MLTFIGIVAIPSKIDVAIEHLGDQIEDQNEINQDIKQTLGNKIEGLAERIEPLEELQENIEEQGRRLKRKCPVGGQYKLIHGVCYFFDTTIRTFDEAQANCKQIFGPTGKIYEPKTEAEVRIWYDNYGSGKLLKANVEAWVGITDRESEGVFKYASSGTVVPESALFWYSGQSNNSGNNDCVANNYYTIKDPFNVKSCSSGYRSICEW